MAKKQNLSHFTFPSTFLTVAFLFSDKNYFSLGEMLLLFSLIFRNGDIWNTTTFKRLNCSCWLFFFHFLPVTLVFYAGNIVKRTFLDNKMLMMFIFYLRYNIWICKPIFFNFIIIAFLFSAWKMRLILLNDFYLFNREIQKCFCDRRLFYFYFNVCCIFYEYALSHLFNSDTWERRNVLA